MNSQFSRILKLKTDIIFYLLISAGLVENTAYTKKAVVVRLVYEKALFTGMTKI